MVRLDSRATNQQARLAEANYETAVEALRRQLNMTAEMQLDLAGAITDFEWLSIGEAGWGTGRGTGTLPSDVGSLAKTLAGARPDVMAARHSVSAARSNYSLAEASKTPNVMLGPFYVRDAAGTLNLGFQAQMDLPVVNSGQPLADQRHAEFHQQCTMLQQLEARAVTEAETALTRYERARRVAAESRESFQESLPEELKRLEALYRKGDVDILRVLQARTSMLALHRAHLDSLNEVAQASAALTAATGLPPHKLVRETGSGVQAEHE
jgi:outer membrane protein TolC